MLGLLSGLMALRSIITGVVIIGVTASAAAVYAKKEWNERRSQNRVLDVKPEFDCQTQENLTTEQLEKCRRER